MEYIFRTEYRVHLPPWVILINRISSTGLFFSRDGRQNSSDERTSRLETSQFSPAYGVRSSQGKGYK